MMQVGWGHPTFSLTRTETSGPARLNQVKMSCALACCAGWTSVSRPKYLMYCGSRGSGGAALNRLGEEQISRKKGGLVPGTSAPWRVAKAISARTSPSRSVLST